MIKILNNAPVRRHWSCYFPSC